MTDQQDKNRSQMAFSITLGAVVGQVGCLTLVIILVALFGGLWLDSHFNTRPLFTIGLTIASVPVTLILMFWVVRTATARLQTGKKANNPEPKEGSNGGTEK